jgi:small subunit ribosomal protein S17
MVASDKDKKAAPKAAPKKEAAPKAAPTQAAASEGGEDRKDRRTLVGEVTSDKMQKTVVVRVVHRVRSAQYHKYLTKRVKYKAHDEKNEYKIGDKVEIAESRPLSRDKRWRVTRLIERAKESIQANA